MAFEIMEAKLGRSTHTVINPVTSSVATTVTQILRNNPNRIFVLVTNLGATDMFIGWDREVSSSRGVRVPNSGGIVSLAWEEDYELCFQEMFAVAITAAVNIYVVEINLGAKKPAAGV